MAYTTNSETVEVNYRDFPRKEICDDSRIWAEEGLNGIIAAYKLNQMTKDTSREGTRRQEEKPQKEYSVERPEPAPAQLPVVCIVIFTY